MNDDWTSSEFIETLRRSSLLQLRRFHSKNKLVSGPEKRVNIIKFIQEGIKGDEMKQIIPGLWLGTHIDVINGIQLKSHNIHCLMNASAKIGFFGKKRGDKYQENYNSDLNYFHVGLDEPTGLPFDIKLEHSFEFIQETLKEGKNILVYCFNGISRSTTLVIAYLMRCKEMSCEQALGVIEKQYSQMKPNLGFAVFFRDFNWALDIARDEGKIINLDYVKELIIDPKIRPATPAGMNSIQQHQSTFLSSSNISRKLLAPIKIKNLNKRSKDFIL